MNSYNEGPIWGKTGCDIFALMGSYNGIGNIIWLDNNDIDKDNNLILIS